MIQYDPRLQGRPNGTDVLGGPQTQQPPQDTGMASTSQQPAQPQQDQQTNLATKKPSSGTSGMYTNIQQYAERNKPAAQQMSQSVGQTVQRSADIARKNIQATRQQFENLRETGSLQNRETAVGDVTSAAQAAAGMQVDQPTAGDERLKAILDAVYKGPKRLQQMGSFGESQRRAQEAGRLTQQLTGGNQNELLKKSLERQGQRYTQGSRQLDKLLLGNEEPKKYLQQRQQQIGNVGQDLGQAIQSAKQDAIKRVQELQDIRNQARESLQSTASQRAQQVEDYISGQKQVGSQLADYYKNVLTGGTTFNEEGKLVDAEGNEVTPEGLQLGSLEAATLGVKSGAGLYNLLRDKIEREALLQAFDPSRLISEQMITKNQQGQLAELQRLAQLSEAYGTEGSGLDFRSAYQDAKKAGAQTATSAIDLDKFKSHLTGAERAFREQAAQTTTGSGRGSATYGNWWNEGKTTQYATKSAVLKDLLETQGYDFNAPIEDSIINPQQAQVSLENLSKITKGKTIDTSDYNWTDYLSPGAVGNELLDMLGLSDFAPSTMLSTTGELVQNFGKDIGGDLIGGTLGSWIESGLGALGGGIADVSEAILGTSKSAAKSQAKAKAQRAALADLKSKLTRNLSSSGFDQRLNVADTEETTQRIQDLMDILSRLNTEG